MQFKIYKINEKIRGNEEIINLLEILKKKFDKNNYGFYHNIEQFLDDYDRFPAQTEYIIIGFERKKIKCFAYYEIWNNQCQVRLQIIESFEKKKGYGYNLINFIKEKYKQKEILSCSNLTESVGFFKKIGFIPYKEDVDEIIFKDLNQGHHYLNEEDPKDILKDDETYVIWDNRKFKILKKKIYDEKLNNLIENQEDISNDIVSFRYILDK